VIPEARGFAVGKQPHRTLLERLFAYEWCSPRVSWSGDADKVSEDLSAWAAAGATHVSVNTMGAGLENVDAHLAALESVAAALP
jgi:hypothetical protein